VRKSLTNHKPGFTMFADRSISFENRDFKGLLKVGGTEYEFYSVNDTILRGNDDASYDANLYTHRLKQYPHEGIEVPIGSKALFIVAHSDGVLQVNSGYVNATVTDVIDGRSATVSSPYVTEKGDWVLRVTGDKADKIKADVNKGDQVQISTAVTIGGSSAKVVQTHNSSMYRFMQNGAYGTISTSSDEAMPATVAGVNESGTKMFWVVVDGRSSVSTGMTYYELYRTCKKLGAYNMIRFDGGGSSTMWIYNNGEGSVVNTPSDSKGERSCMNYFHLRIKQ
jgi:hypothetical protein